MQTQKQKQKAIIKTEKHTPTSHNLVQLVHLLPQLVLQDKIEKKNPTHTHTHKLQLFKTQNQIPIAPCQVQTFECQINTLF
jgi:hypothetical protein